MPNQYNTLVSTSTQSITIQIVHIASDNLPIHTDCSRLAEHVRVQQLCYPHSRSFHLISGMDSANVCLEDRDQLLRRSPDQEGLGSINECGVLTGGDCPPRMVDRVFSSGEEQYSFIHIDMLRSERTSLRNTCRARITLCTRRTPADLRPSPPRSAAGAAGT
jgi:hypothetical protein